jgi:hypothetical protein
MIAWMKTEMSSKKQEHTSAREATVCLVAPCLVSTTENQIVAIAETVAAAGMKLHLICCSSTTSPDLQIASLRMSLLVNDHGAQVSFSSPGVT